MRTLIAITAIAASTAASGCRPDYADTRPRSPERNKRLTEAELISAAIFMYADQHDGTLPSSLDALKPDYLGQSVDPSFLAFHYPSGRLQRPRDYRVIASEKQLDSEHRRICIYGHRGVSLLRDGD
jgi:hypothetical protein